MTTDEKLDLILRKIEGLEDSTLEIKDTIVNIHKRLTILEGDTHQINLKIDEIRSWTKLDLKDNPFMKTRAIA